MWGIFGKRLKRAFRRCMGGGGGVRNHIFSRKLAVAVDSLGFFLLVLVRFQTDCTTPITRPPPILGWEVQKNYVLGKVGAVGAL